MPNVKKLMTDSGTGEVIYSIIRRDSVNYLLDDTDGIFRVTSVDKYVSLVEHAVMKGLYEVSESRQVWSDGTYTVAFYRQIGGSPSPVDDSLIKLIQISIVYDTIYVYRGLPVAIPGLQTLYGNILNLNGTVAIGVEVTVRILMQQIVEGVLVTALKLEDETDITGYFELKLLKGSSVVVRVGDFFQKEIIVTDEDIKGIESY